MIPPLHSYTELQKQLGLAGKLPITPDWSAAADFLFLLKEYCLKNKPKVIVECSSGLSSLILAKCCQINNYGQVFSLENGKQYADDTRTQLTQFELIEYANIIHAPLIKTDINEKTYEWYELKQLTVASINMLVIDGPPGFIQKHSRFPALPLLFEQLADQAVIFMDDAARADEKEIVKRWLAAFSNVKHEYIETERGCSIFTINK